MKLFVVEGIDGSGKSLLCAGLIEHFGSRRQYPVRALESFLREDSIYNFARNLIGKCDPISLQLLFSAARQNTLARLSDELPSETLLIADRYTLSQAVYGAATTGIDMDWFLTIAQRIRPPDKTILLDVDLEIARGRTRGDSFEQNSQLQSTAQALYRAWFKAEGNTILDGNQPADAVLREAIQIVEAL